MLFESYWSKMLDKPKLNTPWFLTVKCRNTQKATAQSRSSFFFLALLHKGKDFQDHRQVTSLKFRNMTCAPSSTDIKYDIVCAAVWRVYRPPPSHLIAYSFSPGQCVPQGTLKKHIPFALTHVPHHHLPTLLDNVKALTHSLFSSGHWFLWPSLQLRVVEKSKTFEGYSFWFVHIGVRKVQCSPFALVLIISLSPARVRKWTPFMIGAVLSWLRPVMFG